MSEAVVSSVASKESDSAWRDNFLPRHVLECGLESSSSQKAPSARVMPVKVVQSTREQSPGSEQDQNSAAETGIVHSECSGRRGGMKHSDEAIAGTRQSPASEGSCQNLDVDKVKEIQARV